MKVILTKDVPGLGKAYDIKEVSDGHARNFLIPKHLALPATAAVLDKVQKEEQERQAKISRVQEKLLGLKSELENKTIIIKVRAEKQNLFAAIHEKDIALAINEKFGLEISPETIILSQPVKSLGPHDVEIKLAPNVSLKVKLDIHAV